MELEQLKQENEKLTARLNKAVEVFKEQKANIDALTVKAQTAETDKENALQLFKEVDKQVGELRKENNQLKTQLEETQNKLSTITVVSEDECNYKEMYSELTEKFDSLEAEHEALKVEYNNTVTKMADLNDILDKVKREYEQTQIDLLAAEECNSRNNKELAAADEKIKGFDQELKSFQALNDDLNKQLDQYEIKLSSKEKENADLSDKIDICTKECSKYKDIISKQTEEIEDLKKQVESNSEAYETKIKNLDGAYEELRQKYVDLQEKEISKYKNALNSIYKTIMQIIPTENKQTKNTAVSEMSHSSFMSDAPEFTI